MFMEGKVGGQICYKGNLISKSTRKCQEFLVDMERGFTICLLMPCFCFWLTKRTSDVLGGPGIFWSLSDALSEEVKPLPFHMKAACGLVGQP